MNAASTSPVAALSLLGTAIFFAFLHNGFGFGISLAAFGLYLVLMILGLRLYYRRLRNVKKLSPGDNHGP